MLSKVFMYTNTEWPEKVDEEVKPYARRAQEISIEDGLIMWGYRVLVPKKFNVELLKELHPTYIGVSKMKSLARQYF